MSVENHGPAGFEDARGAVDRLRVNIARLFYLRKLNRSEAPDEVLRDAIEVYANAYEAVHGRLNRLVELITIHSDLHYYKTPLISDAEYDALKDEYNWLRAQ